MDSLKMNLILSQVLNIQGTPATIIGDQMVAGAIPYEDLEGLVKEQLAKAVASKFTRWLRELAMWLLIGAAVSLAVDYFRQPALPQNFTPHRCRRSTGNVVDLHAMSQQRRC
jgi:hypothetical protein